MSSSCLYPTLNVDLTLLDDELEVMSTSYSNTLIFTMTDASPMIIVTDSEGNAINIEVN